MTAPSDPTFEGHLLRLSIYGWTLLALAAVTAAVTIRAIKELTE